LQGGQHFEKVIQRLRLVLDLALQLFGPRVFREDFGDIIGHFPIGNAGTAENVPNQDVEVEMGRDPEAAAAFENRTEERLVIEDEIPGFQIGQKANERLGIRDFGTEDRNNEINILGGELDPTI
jgi:hypothetical protein